MKMNCTVSINILLFVMQSKLDLTFFFQLPKSAKPFRFKVLQNWDDTTDLYAKDRATGHEDETVMDVVDEAMSTETNEVEFMGLIDLE